MTNDVALRETHQGPGPPRRLGNCFNKIRRLNLPSGSLPFSKTKGDEFSESNDV